MEKNTKVLIADESAEFRRQVRDQLIRSGYPLPDEAANGDEALQKIMTPSQYKSYKADMEKRRKEGPRPAHGNHSQREVPAK